MSTRKQPLTKKHLSRRRQRRTKNKLCAPVNRRRASKRMLKQNKRSGGGYKFYFTFDDTDYYFEEVDFTSIDLRDRRYTIFMHNIDLFWRNGDHQEISIPIKAIIDNTYTYITFQSLMIDSSMEWSDDERKRLNQAIREITDINDIQQWQKVVLYVNNITLRDATADDLSKGAHVYAEHNGELKVMIVKGKCKTKKHANQWKLNFFSRTGNKIKYRKYLSEIKIANDGNERTRENWRTLEDCLAEGDLILEDQGSMIHYFYDVDTDFGEPQDKHGESLQSTTGPLYGYQHANVVKNVMNYESILSNKLEQTKQKFKLRRQKHDWKPEFYLVPYTTAFEGLDYNDQTTVLYNRRKRTAFMRGSRAIVILDAYADIPDEEIDDERERVAKKTAMDDFREATEYYGATVEELRAYEGFAKRTNRSDRSERSAFMVAPVDASESEIIPLLEGIMDQYVDLSTYASMIRDPNESKHYAKAMHVINEIYSSEGTYLNNLQVLIEDSNFPQYQTYIQKELSEIIKWSTTFINQKPELDLSKIVFSLQNYGQQFIQNLTTLPITDYKTYCNQYKKNVIRKNNDMAIGNLLIQPVQRIMRYPMLFQALVDEFPEEGDKSLKKQFERARDIVSRYAQEANSSH